MPTPTENAEGASRKRKGAKWLWSIPILVALLIILNHYYQWYPWPWVETTPPAKKLVESKLAKAPQPATATAENKVVEKPAPAPVIDYEKLKKKSDKGLKELVQKRKKEFGVDKSVDMVVASGEQIRVGKEIIPLDRILAEIKAQRKELEASVTTPSRPVKPGAVPLPPEIQESTRAMQAKPDAGPLPPETRVPRRPMPARPAKKPVSYYGVYVVRPGDNLWNIHFAFLREYFGSRGIPIPSDADEPYGSKSSGIGRILKYAETMVHIFNLKTRTLSTNLNLLEPKEKIVIFNLSALNKALAPLTYEQIDTVQFDGRDLTLTE